MFDRVTCTCGKALSHLIAPYRQAYEVKKHIIGNDTLVTHMEGAIPITSMTAGEIFDALQIYNTCCRYRIMTNIKWLDFIGLPTVDQA